MNVNATIDMLKSRVSYPVSMLSPKSPTQEEWSDIFEAVASSPDYGGLLPYRFIVLTGDKYMGYVQAMKQQRLINYPDSIEKIEKNFNDLLTKVDCIVISVCIVDRECQYPESDQIYGAISAVSQFYMALTALGYGTYWISCKDNEKRELKSIFDLGENATITGIFPIGKPTSTRKKKRPKIDKFITVIS